MRQEFFKQLHDLMTEDDRVYFITGDLGYFFADKIREDFPDRFFNVGAAECALLGVGIGLALEGKVPFCYSITPFLLFRPFEAIRNYVDHENIPVILVGSGRGRDYAHDNFSHWGDDDLKYISRMKNIHVAHQDGDEFNLAELVELHKPVYLNLKR